jgi:alpha-L-rhamnosidase
LYGASDVPESEFFGSKPYNIPLYRQDEDYDPRRFGKPGAFVLKFASSAAHVMGKKWVSSETATWLGNHFKVSLRQVKPIVDESFVGGINHIFYHGVPYSPPNAPFPGWLFYASTNFNQQSHFWNELPLLNGYIERCQQLLQNTKPDNDILLYMPLVDWWHAVGKKDKTHVLDVHTLLSGDIYNTSFGKTAKQLTEDGYSFDFVSDRQLQNAKSHKSLLITEGGTQYRAVIIPQLDYIPLETVRALEKLQKAGVLIVFSGKLPRTVHGFLDYEKREKQLTHALKHFVAYHNGYAQAFENQHIRKENLDQQGLQFMRKKTPTGILYFIVNQEQTFKSDSIELSTTAESVQLYDPLNQTKRMIPFRKIGKDKIQIPLHLRSGESVFIETFHTSAANVPAEIQHPTSEMVLKGTWQVAFLKGEPSIPQGFKTEKLDSWTKLSSDTMAQYFSGTARYTLNFNVLEHQAGKAGRFELGDVRESAVVKLNGKTLGTAWCLPYSVTIPEGILLKGNNQLEIEVTNLSANRIRYMDKKRVPWRKFYDINFVDISYKPFDASDWLPVPSGLLGDVCLLTW